MPGIQGCDVTGEGIGSVRAISMGAMTIKEKLESLDADARSLSYSIVEGPMPTENYLATITLSDAGGGKVRVQTVDQTRDPLFNALLVEVTRAKRRRLFAPPSRIHARIAGCRSTCRARSH